jgi:hypothetical protein
MYKVTNEMFGEVVINGKTMGYKAFIIVKDIDAKITELAENKIVKIKPFKEKKTAVKIEDKSNKKKNKEV